MVVPFVDVVLNFTNSRQITLYFYDHVLCRESASSDAAQTILVSQLQACLVARRKKLRSQFGQAHKPASMAIYTVYQENADSFLVIRLFPPPLFLFDCFTLCGAT
jgi:hypothetical protein